MGTGSESSFALAPPLRAKQRHFDPNGGPRSGRTIETIERVTAELRIRPATSEDVPAILKLAREVFPEDPSLASGAFGRDVRLWRELKTLTLVAKGADGNVVGYARSRPNSAHGQERPDGQVAVFTHVAVDRQQRGRGIGVQLHDRSMKALRMLGFSTVTAQLPTHLRTWYENLGWTVHNHGEVVMWIEPSTSAEVAGGRFSPILYLEHQPNYPLVADRGLSDEKPIARWVVQGDTSPGEVDRRLLAGLADLLRANPALAARIPTGLAAAIGREHPRSEAYRRLSSFKIAR